MGLPFGIFREPIQTLKSWAPQLRNIANRKEWLSPEFTWIDYTPGISGGGTMTTTPSDVRGKYIVIGNVVIVGVRAVFTTGGVANATVNVDLPLTTSVEADIFVFNGQIADGGNVSGYGLPVLGTRTMQVGRYDSAVWGIGASRGFRLFGAYELV